MNNTGFKLRSSSARQSNDPVIGDAFDLETYGRPTEQRHAARAHRPERVSTYRITAAPTATPVEPAAAPTPEPRRQARAEEAPVADGVRTVKIKGQATPARRRAAVQIERYDRRPDRAAQWALFMGVFMIVVAIVTGT